MATPAEDYKKVIIIGASSGIGRAMAEQYAQKGFMVGVTGRRGELLLSLQKKYPKNIVVEVFDVTAPENISHLQSLIQKLDGMDVLIYNSGRGEVSEQLDMDIEQHTTKVNVNGFVDMVTYGFNYFANQGYGRLAATSSIASKRGLFQAPAYSASKAFMSNYMEALYIKAFRLKKNIGVTDIQPGFVKTNLAQASSLFWVATPEKAATQMIAAIHKKKKRVYITHRWAIVAAVLRLLPTFIYRRIG
jgi:short-subunit dehydrogenase